MRIPFRNGPLGQLVVVQVPKSLTGYSVPGRMRRLDFTFNEGLRPLRRSSIALPMRSWLVIAMCHVWWVEEAVRRVARSRPSWHESSVIGFAHGYSADNYRSCQNGMIHNSFVCSAAASVPAIRLISAQLPTRPLYRSASAARFFRSAME